MLLYNPCYHNPNDIFKEEASFYVKRESGRHRKRRYKSGSDEESYRSDVSRGAMKLSLQVEILILYGLHQTNTGAAAIKEKDTNIL
jgi:hypothetical protein